MTVKILGAYNYQFEFLLNEVRWSGFFNQKEEITTMVFKWGVQEFYQEIEESLLKEVSLKIKEFLKDQNCKIFKDYDNTVYYFMNQSTLQVADIINHSCVGEKVLINIDDVPEAYRETIKDYFKLV